MHGRGAQEVLLVRFVVDLDLLVGDLDPVRAFRRVWMIDIWRRRKSR
jgi:hypothetical protein